MRYAVNPLQFYATPSGSLDWSWGPPYDQVLAEVARAGWKAVQAQPPAGVPASEYQSMLASFGLRAAPGYFSAPLAEGRPTDELVREFRRFVEYMGELGLDAVVVACELTEQRKRLAGRAIDRPLDAASIERIAHGLETLGEIAKGKGLQLCFHPHVGSPVESPEEVDSVLELTEPELVSLCLDTGHLVWGGCKDIIRYATVRMSRVGMVHLKDLRLAVVQRGRAEAWDYERFVREGLWCEPGRGDLPLSTFLEAYAQLPCWCVVEVDAPFGLSPSESIKVSAEFIARWEPVSRDGS